MMPELSLNILDLAENSIRADADFVEITLDENTKDDILTLVIRDNGKGMDGEFVKQITNPFITTRTTRKVGLGIPFVKQITDLCEGELVIDSEPGQGTELKAVMKNSHIDRPPVGDIVSVIHTLIVLNPNIDFLFIYKVDDNCYSIDTREWKEILDVVPLNDINVQKTLKEDLLSGLKKIGRSLI